MHNMSKQMGYFSRTPHRVPLQLTEAITQTHQEWENVAWSDEFICNIYANIVLMPEPEYRCRSCQPFITTMYPPSDGCLSRITQANFMYIVV